MDFKETDMSEKMKGLTLADEDVPLVHNLDLDSIPAGRISKLWIILFEDALKPISVPVIIAKGTLLNRLALRKRLSSWSCGRYDFFVAWR